MRSLVLGLAFLAAGAPAWGQSPPPATVFGRLPETAQAAISPRGDRVALLGGPAEDRRIDISTLDTDQVVAVPLGPVLVRGIRWAGDGHILLRAARYDFIPELRRGLTVERTIAVDAQGRPVSRLLSNSNMSQYVTALPTLMTSGEPRPTAWVLGLDWRPNDRTAATRIRGNDNELVSTVWRVDVASGRGEIVERGGPATEYFTLDPRGEPRVRVDFEPGTGLTTLQGRARGQSGWRRLVETRDLELGYLGYSDADQAVLMRRESAAGTVAVVRLPLDGGPETVLFDGGWPEAYVAMDSARATPVAVLGGVERTQYHWLDAELQRRHATLQRAFPNREVTLTGWSVDRNRVIARVESRDHPPALYLLDAAARNVSLLGHAYPELEGVRLGTTRFIRYRARDGLEIPAWVTLPPGAPASGGRLPLIVMPHGGPASYDDSGFDWWAQFLATRGYAVIQPQFRGSEGFGRAFRTAGEREWGGKIQTDLLDGIAHLAADGSIDPARVCVVGASFGGYSALAGVTLNPDAYRCAVSVHGVADLPMMLSEERRIGGDRGQGMRYWMRVMGGVDRALLERTSPARRITRDTPPFLLIHGREDTTVPFSQSERMQQAAAAAGRPADLIALEGDDHYLSTSATRTRMLEATEAFLRQHLPVQRPASP